MAANFIKLDTSIPQAAEIVHLFNRLGADMGALAVAFNGLKAKVDGDGSTASQFTLAVSEYGYPDTATAKRSYDEINSVLGNSTALTQAAGYHKQ